MQLCVASKRRKQPNNKHKHCWKDENHIWACYRWKLDDYLSDSINDSIKFWKYLLILKSFIDNWIDVKCENVRFTMDNAPIHVSSKKKKAAEKLGMKWLLLLAFSSSLVPAEWVFGMSKKLLTSQNKTKVINFSKNDGKMMIINSLKWIDKEKGIRVWMQSLKVSRKLFRVWDYHFE